MRCARNSRPRAFRSRRVRGATGSWWSMIPTAISSSSTIRPSRRPARLLEMKHNRAAAPAWRVPLALHPSLTRFSISVMVFASLDIKFELPVSLELLTERRSLRRLRFRGLGGRHASLFSAHEHFHGAFAFARLIGVFKGVL